MTAKEIQKYATAFADAMSRKSQFKNTELDLVSQSHTERAIKLNYLSGVVSIGIAYPTDLIIQMMENVGVIEVKRICDMTTEELTHDIEDTDYEEEEDSNKPTKIEGKSKPDGKVLKVKSISAGGRTSPRKKG